MITYDIEDQKLRQQAVMAVVSCRVVLLLVELTRLNLQVSVRSS